STLHESRSVAAKNPPPSSAGVSPRGRSNIASRLPCVSARFRSQTPTSRGPQRIAWRNREPSEVIEHRRAQLMPPGERELHLRLDTSGTRHQAARRVIGNVIQQRRLAPTRLATHD